MKTSPPRRFIGAALVLIPPAGLLSVVIYFTQRSLGPEGAQTDAQIAGVLTIAGAILALILMLIGLIALIYVRTRRAGVVLLGACLAFTLVSASLTEVVWRLRLSAFSDLVNRSDKLVTAIYLYESDHQTAPRTLESLVPRYLQSIPLTEIARYPSYEFKKLNSNSTYKPNDWLVRVPISQSPPSELLYLPNKDYDSIEQETIRIADWVFIYKEAVVRK